MGRGLKSFGLLIAISFTSSFIYAGDHKSADRDSQNSAAEMFAGHSSHALSVSARPDRFDALVGRPFEGRSSASADRPLIDEKGNDSEPRKEHKSLTLFRFNSQFGEVKVQPVLGKVTGAQFSLGF